MPSDSFAAWLRRLPLKPHGSPVMLYDGSRKANQEAHVAVVNIDIGHTDLQQCADAIIRLRAEYLFFHRQFDRIHFNLTSGRRVDYLRWAAGYRPLVSGNRVRFVKRSGPDRSHANFRRYLNFVFAYAGTLSLSRELKPVDLAKAEIGDVFIRGGSPGHAVMIVDMSENTRTGKRVMLLAQSYMPAQDIHILRNPGDGTISPWYSIDPARELITPEWVFQCGELKRFGG